MVFRILAMSFFGGDVKFVDINGRREKMDIEVYGFRELGLIRFLGFVLCCNYFVVNIIVFLENKMIYIFLE